ncbi:GTPase HflX [Lampropedia puyangensis]|uniref:GTPase HflX n=1 Tax=Lampropedia puyangensis TaxID=1330072 RepID=A0A4S8F5H0_9BURK|nr:GTPase HflX [Lampropedia puyangensis]
MGVDFGEAHFDSELEELGLLAQTAGLQVCDRVVVKRKFPDPAYFIGTGKVQEIKALALGHGAGEIIFDQALSPAQQRNLEREMGMPVYDRTFLILEIFAQRARSHEGKLQVELARLQYLSTRLVRRWSHLERQRGGIGARGGPGETQIELDRRMIGDAIKRVRERLSKLKKQRSTQRRQRQRNAVFNISLVGYTNAGKSSLFNAMVKARAYAADQLFATLDTTTRQLYLQQAQANVSLSDTVGFIRDLPHGLVEAFQATLQEAVDADLLLHVVDASNPHFPEQIQEVVRVLEEIGADQVPQMLVFNKLDRLADAQQPVAMHDTMEIQGRQIPRVFISAHTGQGLDELREVLSRWWLAHRSDSAPAWADEHGDVLTDDGFDQGEGAQV